ncbi:MAG: hypothetical protein H7255_00475 [Ramlibacter sp.]|nr:hypothetical protein [Ramlibacter sp.]
MRRIVFASLLCLCAVFSGCAAVSVERGKDVSSAGVAYSKATSAVIDLAIDALIDTSSQRRLALAETPAQGPAAERREASLRTIDSQLVDNVRDYAKLKRSVAAIEAYFTGLQDLSGATPGDAVEASVKTLADRVNGVSTALGGEARLTDERKGAVAGLAKLVVKQAHGAAIARALERDAAMIGRALALQQIVLQTATADLRAQANEEADRFYRERVIRPYISGGVGATWMNDRRTYIKATALGSASDATQTAAQAALQMQDVWGRILSGESSGKEFMLMIKDINEVLDTAQALKKAF